MLGLEWSDVSSIAVTISIAGSALWVAARWAKKKLLEPLKTQIDGLDLALRTHTATEEGKADALGREFSEFHGEMHNLNDLVTRVSQNVGGLIGEMEDRRAENSERLASLDRRLGHLEDKA